MHKVIKIRCYPNKTQKALINRILGTCRFVYNKFIEYNSSDKERKYVSSYDFSKLLTSWKKDETSEYYWIREIHATKAIKDSINSAHDAYRNAFTVYKKTGVFHRPHFKKKGRANQESFFFIKDNIHIDNGKKNIIHIPILKNIRVTKKNTLPYESFITSGRVIKTKNGKYYLMFIYMDEEKVFPKYNKGIGVDLGIEKYATIAFKQTKMSMRPAIQMHHFKDLKKYKNLKEKIEKLQKIISNKVEINYGRLLHRWLDDHPGEELNEKQRNIMKGESYRYTNIMKLQRKVHKTYQKLTNIRTDYICKLVYNLVVILKPKYITIEKLAISNMLQDNKYKKIHRHISDSSWYMFKQRLIQKCHEYHVELREADKFFASSKTCSCCGHKNTNLTLSDRIYKCDKCGLEIDRDENAALNLVSLKNYSIL